MKMIVITFLLIVVASFTCKVKKEVKIKALVTFVSGKVTLNSKILKTNDIINEDSQIQVGTNSRCNLVIKKADSHYNILINENSRFHLSADSRNNKSMSAIIHSGNVLFNIKKQRSGTAFQTVTPTSIASVRGTQFSMKVREDGTSRATVIKGRVAYRIRLAEIENLPDEVKEKSKILKEVVQILEKDEKILESGQAMTLDKKQAQKKLDSIPEIKEVLSLPAVKKIIENKKLQKTEIDNVTTTIDNYFKKPARRKLLDNSLKILKEKKKISEMKVEEVTKEELSRELENFTREEIKKKDEENNENNLKKVDKKEKKKEPKKQTKKRVSFKERIKEYRKIIKEKKGNVSVKQIAKIMGKKSDTIKLKNGKTLRGVIYQRGSQYIILTTKGRRVVKESDLAEIKF